MLGSHPRAAQTAAQERGHRDHTPTHEKAVLFCKARMYTLLATGTGTLVSSITGPKLREVLLVVSDPESFFGICKL